jgi:spore germination protein
MVPRKRYKGGTCMTWSRSLLGWTTAALTALLMAVGVAQVRGVTWLGWVYPLDRTLLGRAVVMAEGRPRTLAPPTSVHGLPPGMVLGYFDDPADDPQAVDFLKPYASVLTGIIPFWYTIEADGTVLGATNTAVLAYAHAHHWFTFALVRNMNGASVFTPFLASPEAEARAIGEMLALVQEYGYSGINLDFEGIAPSDRQAFTAFVARLAAVFHTQHKYVTLSVPAETSSDPTDSWTGAYNYAALGRAADFLILMAYDEHNQDSAAGPVAASSWVRQVLSYAITVVPPSKIVLGIPGYGYDWSASGNFAVTYEQAETLAAQYHQPTADGHFTYVQDGQVHTVWFENSQTLVAKFNLIEGYELRGMALWRLGIEDPKIWNFLQ